MIERIDQRLEHMLLPDHFSEDARSPFTREHLITHDKMFRSRRLKEYTERSTDDFRNTRTTYANLLAGVTVAPYNVNYHLEHHLLMTVPYHRLPRMHRMLVARGALDEAHVAQNYREIFRRMTQSSRA